MLDENRPTADAAISVGSCSAVAVRLSKLEAQLRGASASQVEAVIGASSLAEISPIDDVRATADFRREAAREIVVRAVRACLTYTEGQKAA